MTPRLNPSLRSREVLDDLEINLLHTCRLPAKQCVQQRPGQDWQAQISHSEAAFINSAGTILLRSMSVTTPAPLFAF